LPQIRFSCWTQSVQGAVAT